MKMRAARWRWLSGGEEKPRAQPEGGVRRAHRGLRGTVPRRRECVCAAGGSVGSGPKYCPPCHSDLLDKTLVALFFT